MKKYLLPIISLVILMSMMVLVGCQYEIIIQKKTTATTTNVTPTTTTPITNPTTTNRPTTTTPTTNGNGGATDPAFDFTLGMGVAFGEHNNGEINATVATVVLDVDGRILACRIDSIQNKFTIDYDYEEIIFRNLRTKMEMGDEYGMSAAINYGMDWNGDGRVLEWYDQAKAFEAHVVGMTAAEVEAMGEAQLPGTSYIISTDADLLAAGCTIQINDFKAAVVKACNDEQAVTFAAVENFTLGVGINSADDGSIFVGEGEVAAKVSLNVEFAGSVIVDGKIVAALNDAYQPAVSIDWEGAVLYANVGKLDAYGNDLGLMTKRELKENYAMSGKPWSPDNDGDGRVLEWYVQSAAFSAHVVGMTAAQVKNMGTKLVNDHYMSTDADLIAAGCTIQITGLMDVVSEAANNAR